MAFGPLFVAWLVNAWPAAVTIFTFAFCARIIEPGLRLSAMASGPTPLLDGGEA